MSQPADLPFATISYTVDRKGQDVRCEVLVDGEPIALLPASGVEAAHDSNKLAYIKLLLHGESIDLQTISIGS